MKSRSAWLSFYPKKNTHAHHVSIIQSKGKSKYEAAVMNKLLVFITSKLLVVIAYSGQKLAFSLFTAIPFAFFALLSLVCLFCFALAFSALFLLFFLFSLVFFPAWCFQIPIFSKFLGISIQFFRDNSQFPPDSDTLNMQTFAMKFVALLNNSHNGF